MCVINWQNCVAIPRDNLFDFSCKRSSSIVLILLYVCMYVLFWYILILYLEQLLRIFKVSVWKLVLFYTVAVQSAGWIDMGWFCSLCVSGLYFLVRRVKDWVKEHEIFSGEFVPGCCDTYTRASEYPCHGYSWISSQTLDTKLIFFGHLVCKFV